MKKKGVVPFSSITSKVKVRHISDESIARCNKNITPLLIQNAIERNKSLSK